MNIHHNYLTFDDMMLRAGAISDPALFVEKLKLPIILDEIQYVPELLSYIKLIILSVRSRRNLVADDYKILHIWCVDTNLYILSAVL